MDGRDFSRVLRAIVSLLLLLAALCPSNVSGVEIDGQEFTIDDLASLRIKVTSPGKDYWTNDPSGQWTGSCDASAQVTYDFRIADTIAPTGAISGDYSSAVAPNNVSAPGDTITVSALVEDPDLFNFLGGSASIHIATVDVLVQTTDPCDPELWVSAGEIPVLIDVPYVAQLEDTDALELMLSTQTSWAGGDSTMLRCNYNVSLAMTIVPTGVITGANWQGILPQTWISVPGGLVEFGVDVDSVDVSALPPDIYHVADVILADQQFDPPMVLREIPVIMDTTDHAVQILDHPDSQSAELGDTVQFEVVAFAPSGTPSYQWRIDGNDIPGAQDANYIIPSVTLADEGTYTCAVTTYLGTVVSDPAVLDLILYPVTFADANLKAAVEAQLGITDPNARDMLSLNRLIANNQGITSLVGLEHATNFSERLNVRDNLIEDIGPLAYLAGATEIWIDRNQVTDVTPLAGLNHVWELTLDDNPITDISPLAGHPTVFRLSIGGCPLDDISVLSSMPALRQLHMHNSPVTDFSEFLELPELTRLYAWNTSFTEMLLLSNMVNMENLRLQNTDVNDISVVATMPALRILYLTGTQVSDISALGTLTNLEDVDLRACPLNTEAHQIYIPQIQTNNPGVVLQYDPPTWRTLMISSTVGGSVVDPGEGAYQYVDNDVRPIQAQADVDHAFVGWTGTAVDAGKVADPAQATTTVTVAGDYTLTAEFASTQPVLFIDPALEAAVEAALGVVDPNGADMWSLTSLTATGLGITDLTGLEYATNLTTLELWSNSIADISALAGLTKLTRVNLADNQISDLSPLSGLFSVTIVHLNDNQITDISPLLGLTHLTRLHLADNQIGAPPAMASLVNLRELFLDNNQTNDISGLSGLASLLRLSLTNNAIADISPLAGLTNLLHLYLDNNQISDLSPLVGLSDLYYLYLRSNQISDISPLAALANLNDLHLESNQVSNVSPLAGLGANLERLYLIDNQVSDLSPLAGLTNLTYLRLQENQITDISPLSGMTELTHLSLYDNQIDSIWALSGLTKLISLDLHANFVDDLSALEFLTSLTELDLNDNYITDIWPLEDLTNLTTLSIQANFLTDTWALMGLTNLTTLDLTGNEIVDITGLSGLTNLDWLDLGSNQIDDVSTLSGLTNLGHLELTDNFVEDVSPLASLTNLWGLYLEDNPVSDISSLSGLANLQYAYLQDGLISDISPLVGLMSLSVVDLRGDPLNAAAYSTHIPQLIADNPGLVIYYDGSLQRTLTVDSMAGGSVVDPGEGVFQYDDGDIIPIQAQAEVNYAFAGWSGTAVDAGKVTDPAQPTTTVTVDADYTLTAQFVTTGTVNIPDPNLKSAIEAELGIVDPNATDMLGLILLSAYSLGIQDLTGLEYATNLTDLYLGDNEIVDVSALAGLTALKELRLPENNVTDLGPLASLTGLTVLNLGLNPLTDVSPLAGLTGLKDLRFGYCPVSDISSLAGLVNLEIVKIQDLADGFSDISALAGMTQMRDLNLSINQISDISTLAGMTDLRVLILGANQISDISPLIGLTSLQQLSLRENPISDITPLAGLTGLTSLDLASCELIVDISAVSGLVNLNKLNLYNNDVVDITPLAALTNLTELDLGGANNVSNIDVLSGLVNLTWLGLAGNPIGDFSPVSGLTNLTSLNLYGTGISDIAPVASFTNLTWMDLRANSLDTEAYRIYIPQIEANNPGMELLYPTAIWRTLTISSTTGGSVIDPGEGAYQYANADVIVIQAAADVDFAFVGWSGTAVEAGKVDDPTQATTTVTVDADYTLVAEFATTLPVNIPGVALKTAIQNALGISHDPNGIDMWGLTSLTANGAGITDLTGLEYATNLVTLNLGSNQIDDISPLAGLTTLTVLGMADNNITDLTPLAGLTKLDLLDLGRNPLTDLSPLAGLTQLRDLRFGYCAISDISPIAGLVNLEILKVQDLDNLTDISALAGMMKLSDLNIGGNQISDISALAGMTQLRFLTIHYNHITSISALSGLTTLEKLWASQNEIVDISPLSQSTGLTFIHLGYNSIANISSLAGMTELTDVDLSANAITDISALAGANGLEYAYLSDNEIVDISALAGKTNMKTLRLRNNDISDVSALAGMTALTQLWLNGNQISDISALAGMTVLTDLNLGGNQISDIDVLADATSLQFLTLQYNQIADISALSGMTALEKLWASENEIADISALTQATDLTVLSMYNNNIADVAPLAGMTKLVEVNLSGNEINDISAFSSANDLEFLYLSENQVVDISALGGKAKMQRLNLRDNDVSDISALSGMTQLTWLELGLNQISDISALAGADDLQFVYLYENQIEDISALAGKVNLEELNLYKNDVIDISPVATLTNLAILNLHWNQVSDIEPLSGLVNLRELLLAGNPIGDISSLSALEQLEWLNLFQTGISDVSPIASFESLTFLDLRSNALNTTAYQIYIPQIEANNPGIEIYYDPVVWRTLTVSSTTGGSVIDPGEGAYQYANAEVIVTQAQAEVDYAFVGWSGTAVEAGKVGDPTQAATTVTVDGNYTLMAAFASTLPVAMPDSNLQSVVEAELGISNPTGVDLWGLTSLDADESSIGSLSGLEYAVNLTELNASDNQISDITPLSGLIHLTKLDLTSNQISDLGPLSGLANLTTLWLDNNHISDVSALGGLTDLTILVLSDNQIGDISALSGLASLTALWIENNLIGDVSKLAGLTDLTSLKLHNNQISNISALSALTKLTVLWLAENQIGDISALSGLTQLTTLLLYDNQIGDISALAGMSNLVTLGLEDNQVSDVSVLAGLTDLTTLQLHNNQIGDISTLSALTNLTKLTLHNNQISDISALVGLTNLTNLWLYGNQIDDISPLSGLTQLTTLLLQHNQISDISPLSGLTDLTRLWLGDNQIGDISPLSGLTNLTYLSLYTNQIGDISVLSGLTSLTELLLNGNQIGDVSPVSGLTNLTELWLGNNQITDVSALSGLTQLTTLEVNGNEIGDISALSGLTNLAVLWLENNQISDISALAGLTNLTELRLHANTISDISSLSGLTNLTWLKVDDNPLSDISALSGLADLRELYLRDCQISDISPLVGFTTLVILDLRGNPLNAAAHTSHIPQLIVDNPGITLYYDGPTWRVLTVGSTIGGSVTSPGEGDHPYISGQIVAIQAVEEIDYVFAGWSGTAVDAGKVDNFTQASTTVTVDGDYTLTAEFATTLAINIPDPILKTAIQSALGIATDPTGVDMLFLMHLDIAGLGVTDLAGLEYATNLQSLWAWDNPISDLSPLANLTSLAFLYLDNDQLISDLTPLTGLTQLVRLSLPGNQISQIDALANLTNVDELRLEVNQIADISALANLTNLVKLWVHDNQISEVSVLSNLSNVQELYLQDNQINDISPLVGLTNLTVLDLRGNPLGLDAITTDIPQIIADNPGIQIYHDTVVTYPLTISSTNGGWTEPGEGEHLYPAGTVVSVEAKPREGYRFVDWSGNLTSSSNPLEFVMEHDFNIQANFVLDTSIRYALTVGSGEGGTVVSPGSGEFEFTNGAVIPIEAVMTSSVYQFDRWVGTAVDMFRVEDPTSPRTTVRLDGDYTLEPIFVERSATGDVSLGHTLGQIDVDNLQEYDVRVVTNNTPEVAFVERVIDTEPDPNGMMRLQVIDAESARVKAYFGPCTTERVLVRFSYLFESPEEVQLLIYLSDVPHLVNLDDPAWSDHHAEIGAVALPPTGRPGALGSGRFATFEVWTSTYGLDLGAGTWVELELASLSPSANLNSVRHNGFRLATEAGGDGSVLCDDWAVQVHCDGICMDLNWSDTVDEEDFVLVIAGSGREAGLTDDGQDSLWCLDGLFTNDRYIDSHDLHPWSWALNDDMRLNFCPQLPISEDADRWTQASVFAPFRGSRPGRTLASLTDLPGQLTVIGKSRMTGAFVSSDLWTDSMCLFENDLTFVVDYVEADVPRWGNLRAIAGPGRSMYLVNSEHGLLQIDDEVTSIVPAGTVSYGEDPRFQSPATVQIGIQEDGWDMFGRPIADAAFDSDGNIYVAPVVVRVEDQAPYLAAARLQRRVGVEPPYTAVQLYDDPPLVNDNQYRNHLREIEVDQAGNVYLVNAHALNESCIVWKYASDGTLLNRLDLLEPNSPARVADPLALHVSLDGQTLYLASGQCHWEGPDRSIIYKLSTTDFSSSGVITIQNMRQITGITEDPATGDLWIAGFNMPEIPEYPNPYDDPFYSPALARAPAGADTVQAVDIADPTQHNLALPTSVIWIGE